MTRDEINPTADLAIARADGDQLEDAGDAPLPDREWVPQLYANHGLVETARIAGLSVAQVRAILQEQGVPIRGRGRPHKAA